LASGKPYAKYGKFNIGDEQAQYRLEVDSLLQKTEIMTEQAVTMLYLILAPGGTAVATTPI